MRTVILVLAMAAALDASAATPPIPTVSGPITGPGRMYPDPAVSITPGAVKVEDFPYVMEEYYVSGTIGDAPYMTRIIVRRPRNAAAFSGTVVSEALHAGGRSLIFEWSRQSILTRNHMFVEIVHSGANINLLVHNDVVDPISGAVPHRSVMCRVWPLASSEDSLMSESIEAATTDDDR